MIELRDPMTLAGFALLGLALFWAIRSGWRPNLRPALGMTRRLVMVPFRGRGSMTSTIKWGLGGFVIGGLLAAAGIDPLTLALDQLPSLAAVTPAAAWIAVVRPRDCSVRPTAEGAESGGYKTW